MYNIVNIIEILKMDTYSCSNLSTGQLFSSLSLGQKSPKSQLLGFCNILESIGVHHISRDRRNNTSQNRGHSV